jgi:hypothetical protein
LISFLPGPTAVAVIRCAVDEEEDVRFRDLDPFPNRAVEGTRASLRGSPERHACGTVHARP